MGICFLHEGHALEMWDVWKHAQCGQRSDKMCDVCTQRIPPQLPPPGHWNRGVMC